MSFGVYRTCKVDGCEAAAVARGWCHTHWAQWRRTGDPVPHLKPRAWTEAEDAVLLDLPMYPRSGKTRHGYLKDAALMLERTDAACRGRLMVLRKRERARNLNTLAV